MKLRDLDLQRVIKKIDKEVEAMGYDFLVELEDVYEIWTWHKGMG